MKSRPTLIVNSAIINNSTGASIVFHLKRAAATFWATERAMAITALAGAAEALLLSLWIAVRGSPLVAPEGDLSRTAIGAAALAAFTVVSAALLGLADLDPAERARWRRVFLICVWYPYCFHALQNLRGINPRFSQVDTYPEHFGRYLLFISSQAFVMLYAVLAWSLARRRDARAGLRLLAARYGLASLTLCFIAGYAMVVRWMIDPFAAHSKTMLISHGLAFDGLPVLLGASWVLERSALARDDARRWLHLTGAAWVACSAFWVARAFLDLEPGGAALGIATASALVGPLAGILLKALAQLRLPARERAVAADR